MVRKGHFTETEGKPGKVGNLKTKRIKVVSDGWIQAI